MLSNLATSLYLGFALLASSPAMLSKTSDDTLWIESGSAHHSFSVEVARTADDQRRGLMYRREMARDAGMLFPFDEERIANFWMKNTYISLDIIFLDEMGTITSIAERTVPRSLKTSNSGRRVSGVLEINGGLSQELGIKVGDIVHHNIFDNAESCPKDSLSGEGCQ